MKYSITYYLACFIVEINVRTAQGGLLLVFIYYVKCKTKSSKKQLLVPTNEWDEEK